MALGICDALRDAELLAEAAAAGLSGRRPLDDALADYQRRRDEATLPGYRENLVAAQLKPAPEQRGLVAALRGDPAAANHFFMAREGMVPPETFFNRENLQRVMAGASGSRRGAASRRRGERARALGAVEEPQQRAGVAADVAVTGEACAGSRAARSGGRGRRPCRRCRRRGRT